MGECVVKLNHHEGRFRIVKHYPSLVSVAFRQWRAKSHCRFVHGYALSFEITFSSDELSDEGWVIGFGDLASIKDELKRVFDHKMLVANDDPDKDTFLLLESKGLARLTWLDHVCCESLACYVSEMVENHLRGLSGQRKVYCQEVKISEHPFNAAIYQSNIM